VSIVTFSESNPRDPSGPAAGIQQILELISVGTSIVGACVFRREKSRALARLLAFASRTDRGFSDQRHSIVRSTDA
jgi:hypothetical protein